MKNQTSQCSACKSSPLMRCSCWDTHVNKSWASETKHKVSFIDLEIVASRIYGVTRFILEILGVGLLTKLPKMFYWNSYCSFRDIVPDKHLKNVRGGGEAPLTASNPGFLSGRVPVFNRKSLHAWTIVSVGWFRSVDHTRVRQGMGPSI